MFLKAIKLNRMFYFNIGIVIMIDIKDSFRIAHNLKVVLGKFYCTFITTISFSCRSLLFKFPVV